METPLECRICLRLFNYYDVVNIKIKIIDHKTVSEAIEEVASVEVSENDIFPKQICQSCLRSLESALAFRQQVISSHITLKKRHQSDLCDPLFISCEETTLKNNSLLTSESTNLDEDEKLKVKVEGEVFDKPDHVKSEQESNGARPKTSDCEDGDSDWDDLNNENNSSDDCFEEKPKKNSFSITARKKPLRNRRKRKILKKPLKEISDTSSSSDSDSDLPLEELRKGINDLQRKTGSKVRKKREKNDNADGPRLCPICGKLFKARQNFNSHMTTVHRKKPEKPDKISCLCPDCGRVITGTRQNFVAHRRYHHSDKAQVKKRFTCDVCPRKFYREKNLIIHQRIHKGEKGYVCELCPDKSYTQIGGLILHRRKVHLKKPTCTCNYCGKQFYEKHYLETHIRQWHTGERPFSCEICGKAFSCNGTLLRHRKDSHGEKRPCPKCGKMYTEGELRKHLKRHKIREEGIKRKKYTCEYCGTEMNFTSRKRHLLKQHGIMLRGRGENAERVPITRADAL